VLEQTTIDSYLEDVDSYLRIDAAHRRRVLTEIEGHLHDAIEAHIADGVQPQDALRRAIADVGSPQDVAMQFSPAPPAARSIRGWRRWTPIAMPTVVLAGGLVLIAWNLVYLEQHGQTRGVQIALRNSLLYTAVAGALTASTVVAIHNGDRDAAWRRAAWVFAGVTGLVVVSSYAF
jgi:sensor c-di-GMP phosphodiesterase-like protein